MGAGRRLPVVPSGADTRAFSSASGATSVASGRGRGSPPSQPRPRAMSPSRRWPLRTLTVGQVAGHRRRVAAVRDERDERPRVGDLLDQPAELLVQDVEGGGVGVTAVHRGDRLVPAVGLDARAGASCRCASRARSTGCRSARPCLRLLASSLKPAMMLSRVARSSGRSDPSSEDVRLMICSGRRVEPPTRSSAHLLARRRRSR